MKVRQRGQTRGSSAKPRLHLLKGEGKSIGKGLRKISIHQLDAAISELERRKAATEAIHDARTYIKKIRAILLLSAPAFRRTAREKLKADLKAASETMGPLRDADVHLETFDALVREQGLNDQRLSTLRAGLMKLASRRRIKALPRINSVVATLGKIRDGAQTWPVHDLNAEELRKRIRLTYRRGRDSLELCAASGDPEHFHTWRKHVKQLWYQLRLTARFWSGNASKLIRQSGEIGELAGRERDLTLLKDTLGKGHAGNDSNRVMWMIEAELPRLRGEAIRKGKSFYRDSPKEFVSGLDL